MGNVMAVTRTGGAGAGRCDVDVYRLQIVTFQLSMPSTTEPGSEPDATASCVTSLNRSGAALPEKSGQRSLALQGGPERMLKVLSVTLQ
jgi:hypothetical protein